jgi:hypothetical protein
LAKKDALAKGLVKRISWRWAKRRT